MYCHAYTSKQKHTNNLQRYMDIYLEQERPSNLKTQSDDLTTGEPHTRQHVGIFGKRPM